VKYIKPFLSFIFEEVRLEPVESISIDILKSLQDSNKTDQYQTVYSSEHTGDFYFDLDVVARWDSSPIFSRDEHFKELRWEEKNFKDFGYSINAIVDFSPNGSLIPHMNIMILLDPTREDILYPKLKARLNGIIHHELNHLDQIGLNSSRPYFKTGSPQDRKNAQSNYRYFLLPEEIDSMVDDKIVQAQLENRPVDEIMIEYLTPFLEDGFMTNSELNLVLRAWIELAIQKYPTVNFSSNVDSIINSI
jgi:hypothetical protein